MASLVRIELARLRWTLALATGALLLVGLAFAQVWTWGLFDTFTFQPRFADTVAILAAGEAHHAGLNVYQTNPIDPLGRPHVYGPWWLVTGSIGLTIRDANWVGAVLAVTFIVVAAVTLAPRRPREALLGLLLLCSPPVLLGVGRGNNDLVVFLLFAGASWLLARRSESVATLGRALVGLAAVLKLYPFAALPVILLRRGIRGERTRVDQTPAPANRDLASASTASPDQSTLSDGRVPRNFATPVMWFICTLGACLLVLWLWQGDYRQAIHLAPDPITPLAYGFPVTLAMLKGLAGFQGSFDVAWLLGFLLAVALLGTRVRQLWTSVPEAGFAAHAFVTGALAWIFCFFAIRNYPYRLLLLLLPARVWLDHSTNGDDHEAGRRQFVLWLIVAWLDIPKRILPPLIIRDPSLTNPAWTWFKITIGVEQGLITGLTVCLTVSVVGVFIRVFRTTLKPLPRTC